MSDDDVPPAPSTPNPDLLAELGEDPARFLGRDVEFADGAVDLTLARIRGIRDEDVLDGWLDLEARVFQRRRVVAALNRQRELIRSLGAFEDVLDDGARRRAERDREVADVVEDDEEPVAYRHVACGSTDVERISAMALTCHGCGQRVPNARVEEVEV